MNHDDFYTTGTGPWVTPDTKIPEPFLQHAQLQPGEGAVLVIDHTGNLLFWKAVNFDRQLRREVTKDGHAVLTFTENLVFP